jgi:ABC-type Fe3+/spermidine/putrescine transport system ATPase subunit
MTEQQPLLKTVDLSKHFGGLVAVDNVSLEVYPGEVIGLVGDNGAGKSTLIKMISGVYHPDEGKIFLGGQEVNFSTPMEARNQGIETIYQDLALCENLDATVNIFLGPRADAPAVGPPQGDRPVAYADGVRECSEQTRHPYSQLAAPDAPDVGRPAPGGGHCPGRLLECPPDDYGRTDSRSGGN